LTAALEHRDPAVAVPEEEPRPELGPAPASPWRCSIVLPLRVVSEANERGHWSDKAARSRNHRHVTTYAVRSKLPRRVGAPVSIHVWFTRFGVRLLDDDNLVGAFKACRDGVADALGVNDRDVRYTWHYDQKRGPYSIRIDLEIVGGLEAAP